MPSIRTVPHWTYEPKLVVQATPGLHLRQRGLVQEEEPLQLRRRWIRHEPAIPGHLLASTTHAARIVTVEEQSATTCRYAQIETDSCPPQPQHPR